MRDALFCALTALVLATVAAPAQAQVARGLDLLALTSRNELLAFNERSPAKIRSIQIEGAQGKLLGMDIRPADGRLYGLALDGQLYTIDPATGAAKPGARLSVALEAIDYVAVDFNPQADRLRVIGSTGQSLRVNVENGQTIADGRLAYHVKDRHAGQPPMVLAAAYINSFPGTQFTQLFDFDSANPGYVVQDPPNDGTLRTVAPARVPRGELLLGADIHTDAQGYYHGFVMVGPLLHRFDVGTGRLTRLGRIGDGSRPVIDLAVVSPR